MLRAALFFFQPLPYTSTGTAHYERFIAGASVSLHSDNELEHQIGDSEWTNR